jgi:hypothetical protein
MKKQSHTLIVICIVIMVIRFKIESHTLEELVKQSVMYEVLPVYQYPVTVGFGAHGRFSKALESIRSVRVHYKDVPIIVVDDGRVNNSRYFEELSNVEYIKLDNDVGLSVTRNTIVNNSKTYYTFITDEDIHFPEDRPDMLSTFIRILEGRHDIPIVAGKLNDRGHYHALITPINDTFAKVCNNKKYTETIRGEKCELSDRVLNLFLSRTSFLKDFPWDGGKKLSEHTAHFVDIKLKRNGFKMAACSDFVFTHHSHGNSKEYSKDRGRKNVFTPFNYRVGCK